MELQDKKEVGWEPNPMIVSFPIAVKFPIDASVTEQDLPILEYLPIFTFFSLEKARMLTSIGKEEFLSHKDKKEIFLPLIFLGDNKDVKYSNIAILFAD